MWFASLLFFAITAAPLLVVAACGMDKGLKGCVPYHITLIHSCTLIGFGCMWHGRRVKGVCYVPYNPYTQLHPYWLWLHVASRVACHVLYTSAVAASVTQQKEINFTAHLRLWRMQQWNSVSKKQKNTLISSAIVHTNLRSHAM